MTTTRRRNALYLFVGFAAVAVLGGLFGAMMPVRRLIGRFRPVADPARRRGAVAATVTALALVGSTVLATLGGVLIAANGDGAVAPGTGLDWTVLAVGMAMLGGTSAYGRRGGIFGTLLAVCLVVMFLAWTVPQGWSIGRWALGGATLGAGLLVTRLVETFGRPRPAPPAAVAPGPARPLRDGATSGGWADDPGARAGRRLAVGAAGTPERHPGGGVGGPALGERAPALGRGRALTRRGRASGAPELISPVRLGGMTETPASGGRTFDELDKLSTEELREQAFNLARERRDVGFFWSVLRHLPNADEAAALDGAPNSIGPTIDEANALWRELTGHGYEESAPLLRAAFIDYLMKH